jgi:hypothetical protein
MDSFSLLVSLSGHSLALVLTAAFERSHERTGLWCRAGGRPARRCHGPRPTPAVLVPASRVRLGKPILSIVHGVFVMPVVSLPIEGDAETMASAKQLVIERTLRDRAGILGPDHRPA